MAITYVSDWPAYTISASGSSAQASCEALAAAVQVRFGAGPWTGHSGGGAAWSDAQTVCDMWSNGSFYDHTAITSSGTADSPSGGASSATSSTISCSASCAVSVDFNFPVLQLDAAGGAAIAGAVLAVWALGYAFRMLVRVFSIDGEKTESDT